MARELSQEAVLDFLWAAGGRAPNTALLRHFQTFLRDPALTEQQRRERREYFKSLVNSLATVHPGAAPGASKDIVLRRRYRDLLDEELPPPPEEQQEEEEKEPQPPPPRRDRPSRSRSPPLPPGPGVLPPTGSAPFVTLPPQRPRGPPPAQSLPSDPGVLPPDRLPQSRSPPQPCTRVPPLKVPPPSAGPAGRPPTGPSQSPLLSSGPRGLSPTELPLSRLPQPPLAEPPPARCLPLLSAPAVLPLSRSLQTLPTSRSPSPPLSPGPDALPSTRLPPSQSSNPPTPLPVFRSIRCQLALQDVQGITSLLPNDCGRQPRTMSTKSCCRNVTSRGLSVPLGQREHAWLVAVSAGRWAQVRALFLEEPELALQRDFMSGFTVLHWLAKHGDGPGLQELAAAARQAGLALDVDARSGCGYTPLHLAAIHGHQLVIRVLVLQLGCQVQVRDGSGRRPWEYLGSSTSGEIWQLLEAPRGTIMFPTKPLARSVSSVSKVSLSAGRAALPACLRPQHGHGAASHRSSSESD
uniref:SOWAHA-C winged helix-turn-helix domain-containing protein n=1 Tax=Calidris pygmaea TaxID=425635 RepID=A0A8C3PGR4_9CHAR